MERVGLHFSSRALGNENTTASTGFFWGALFLLGWLLLGITAAEARSQDEATTPEWGYELVGFKGTRAGLLSPEQALELADELVSDPGATAQPRAQFKYLLMLDGMVWGNSEDEFVAQFYDRSVTHPASVWSWFGEPDRTDFPAGTLIAGTNGLFRWAGAPNAVVEVLATDDMARPGVTGTINAVLRFIRFALDPQLAIKRYAPQVSQWDEVEIDALLPRRHVKLSVRGLGDEAAGREHRLIVWEREVPDEAGVQKLTGWLHLTHNPTEKTSFIVFGELRAIGTDTYRLPMTPGDILTCHHRLPSLADAIIHDYTGTADWPAGDVVQKDHHANWTPLRRAVGSFLCAAVLLLHLTRCHLAKERTT